MGVLWGHNRYYLSVGREYVHISDGSLRSALGLRNKDISETSRRTCTCTGRMRSRDARVSYAAPPASIPFLLLPLLHKNSIQFCIAIVRLVLFSYTNFDWLMWPRVKVHLVYIGSVKSIES